MSLLSCILESQLGFMDDEDTLLGFLDEDPRPTPNLYTPEIIAIKIVNKILAADTPANLHKALNDEDHPSCWYHPIAKAILYDLASTIKNEAYMAQVAADARTKAEDAAIDFDAEHPIYNTVLSIGVLAVLAPWVLEILGFEELGLDEGSFAAAWQKTYRDYVKEEALFRYLQMLRVPLL
ncbi:hypothetical protein BJX99DRAFT_257804 [Aspergillus californicus]